MSLRRLFHPRTAVFAIAAAVVVACTPTPPVAPPEIDAFTATPASIVVGEASTLTWDVTGATSVVVTDAADTVIYDGDVVAGSQAVTPTTTTVYTLTATGPGGTATADATVTVGPAAPVVDTFTATPATIDEGNDATLAWTVSGATSVDIVDAVATPVVTGGAASGSVQVSPTVTTVYTLTATGPGGSASADVTVTVVPAPAPPVITAFTAEIVRGSQAALSWTATNATSFDVLAVLDGNPSDTVVLATGVTGTGTTVAIPASDRQRLRLVATGPIGPDDTAELVLQNVVVDAGDYDPYDLQGIVPEPEVPGTLRSVLANAPAGSVIGFASDITTVTLYGVDVEYVSTQAVPGNVDAHLIIRDDVTVSGPPARVTIEGVSGWAPGDPGDPFTYRSRLVFTMASTQVLLENLVLTGGTFIFNGGAIRNDGTLTIDDVEITGNRAWLGGGAIWNAGSGDLTILESAIRNNRAVTEDAEVDVDFAIRGGSVVNVTGNNGYGGAVFNRPGGTVTIVDSVIENNEAKVSGGAIYNDEGTVTIQNTTVQGNQADRNAYAADPSLYGYGGAIYNGGSATLVDVDLLDNTVSDQGGGLYHGVDSLSTLTRVFVDGNFAGTGGGPGYGGGIMHTYYSGEAGNLSLSAVTYGTNTPQNILNNDVGPRPPGLSADGAERGPRPGIFYQPPGVDPDDRGH